MNKWIWLLLFGLAVGGAIFWNLSHKTESPPPPEKVAEPTTAAPAPQPPSTTSSEPFENVPPAPVRPNPAPQTFGNQNPDNPGGQYSYPDEPPPPPPPPAYPEGQSYPSYEPPPIYPDNPGMEEEGVPIPPPPVEDDF